MSKQAAPNPGTRYPGLRGSLTDMFKRNPTRTFDINQLRKSFKGTSDSALTYHLSQLKIDKVVETPKRGFYQYNPEFKTVEEIRELVAARPDALRMETSQTGFAFGKQNGISAIDEYWKKLLSRAIEGLIARTESSAPAREVFTGEDREMLQELLTIATGERSSSMTNMKAKETAPV